MLEIDPLLETRSAIGKTLSRIHRDTRFLTTNPFIAAGCG
jgi:hypothetical protein